MGRGNFEGGNWQTIVNSGHSAVICAKTAEPIEVPFGLWARMGRKHHVLHWRSRSPLEVAFYNCVFFKFIHIYIIFYHSEYHLLNFVINQRQNGVICINNYVNELPFGCCGEFNLCPKFPSEAWRGTGVFPDHTLTFCLRIKVMDQCFILHYCPVEKKIVAGLASDKEGQCKCRHDFASVRPLMF